MWVKCPNCKRWHETDRMRKKGSKGGQATRDKYGKDYYRDIGRKGLDVRYGVAKEDEIKEPVIISKKMEKIINRVKKVTR